MDPSTIDGGGMPATPASFPQQQQQYNQYHEQCMPTTTATPSAHHHANNNNINNKDSSTMGTMAMVRGVVDRAVGAFIDSRLGTADDDDHDGEDSASPGEHGEEEPRHHNSHHHNHLLLRLAYGPLLAAKHLDHKGLSFEHVTLLVPGGIMPYGYFAGGGGGGGRGGGNHNHSHRQQFDGGVWLNGSSGDELSSHRRAARRRVKRRERRNRRHCGDTAMMHNYSSSNGGGANLSPSSTTPPEQHVFYDSFINPPNTNALMLSSSTANGGAAVGSRMMMMMGHPHHSNGTANPHHHHNSNSNVPRMGLIEAHCLIGADGNALGGDRHLAATVMVQPSSSSSSSCSFYSGGDGGGSPPSDYYSSPSSAISSSSSSSSSSMEYTSSSSGGYSSENGMAHTNGRGRGRPSNKDGGGTHRGPTLGPRHGSTSNEGGCDTSSFSATMTTSASQSVGGGVMITTVSGKGSPTSPIVMTNTTIGAGTSPSSGGGGGRSSNHTHNHNGGGGGGFPSAPSNNTSREVGIQVKIVLTSSDIFIVLNDCGGVGSGASSSFRQQRVRRRLVEAGGRRHRHLRHRTGSHNGHRRHAHPSAPAPAAVPCLCIPRVNLKNITAFDLPLSTFDLSGGSSGVGVGGVGASGGGAIARLTANANAYASAYQQHRNSYNTNNNSNNNAALGNGNGNGSAFDAASSSGMSNAAFTAAAPQSTSMFFGGAHHHNQQRGSHRLQTPNSQGGGGAFPQVGGGGPSPSLSAPSSASTPVKGLTLWTRTGEKIFISFNLHNSDANGKQQRMTGAVPSSSPSTGGGASALLAEGMDLFLTQLGFAHVTESATSYKRRADAMQQQRRTANAAATITTAVAAAAAAAANNSASTTPVNPTTPQRRIVLRDDDDDDDNASNNRKRKRGVAPSPAAATVEEGFDDLVTETGVIVEGDDVVVADHPTRHVDPHHHQAVVTADGRRSSSSSGGVATPPLHPNAIGSANSTNNSAAVTPSSLPPSPLASMSSSSANANTNNNTRPSAGAAARPLLNVTTPPSSTRGGFSTATAATPNANSAAVSPQRALAINTSQQQQQQPSLLLGLDVGTSASTTPLPPLPPNNAPIVTAVKHDLKATGQVLDTMMASCRRDGPHLALALVASRALPSWVGGGGSAGLLGQWGDDSASDGIDHAHRRAVFYRHVCRELAVLADTIKKNASTTAAATTGGGGVGVGASTPSALAGASLSQSSATAALASSWLAYDVYREAGRQQISSLWGFSHANRGFGRCATYPTVLVAPRDFCEDGDECHPLRSLEEAMVAALSPPPPPTTASTVTNTKNNHGGSTSQASIRHSTPPTPSVGFGAAAVVGRNNTANSNSTSTSALPLSSSAANNNSMSLRGGGGGVGGSLNATLLPTPSSPTVGGGGRGGAFPGSDRSPQPTHQPLFPAATGAPTTTTTRPSLGVQQYEEAFKYRTKGRVQALTYYHAFSGTAILRCSQPTLMNRGAAKEMAIAIKKTAKVGPVVVFDLRPFANAAANTIHGGSYESPHAGIVEVRFCCIPNIHGVSSSYDRLTALCQSGGPRLQWHVDARLAHTVAGMAMAERDRQQALLYYKQQREHMSHGRKALRRQHQQQQQQQQQQIASSTNRANRTASTRPTANNAADGSAEPADHDNDAVSAPSCSPLPQLPAVVGRSSAHPPPFSNNSPLPTIVATGATPSSPAATHTSTNVNSGAVGAGGAAMRRMGERGGMVLGMPSGGDRLPSSAALDQLDTMASQQAKEAAAGMGMGGVGAVGGGLLRGVISSVVATASAIASTATSVGGVSPSPHHSSIPSSRLLMEGGAGDNNHRKSASAAAAALSDEWEDGGLAGIGGGNTSSVGGGGGIGSAGVGVLGKGFAAIVGSISGGGSSGGAGGISSSLAGGGGGGAANSGANNNNSNGTASLYAGGVTSLPFDSTGKSSNTGTSPSAASAAVQGTEWLDYIYLILTAAVDVAITVGGSTAHLHSPFLSGPILSAIMCEHEARVAKIKAYTKEMGRRDAARAKEAARERRHELRRAMVAAGAAARAVCEEDAMDAQLSREEEEEEGEDTAARRKTAWAHHDDDDDDTGDNDNRSHSLSHSPIQLKTETLEHFTRAATTLSNHMMVREEEGGGEGHGGDAVSKGEGRGGETDGSSHSPTSPPIFAPRCAPQACAPSSNNNNNSTTNNASRNSVRGEKRPVLRPSSSSASSVAPSTTTTQQQQRLMLSSSSFSSSSALQQLRQQHLQCSLFAAGIIMNHSNSSGVGAAANGRPSSTRAPPPAVVVVPNSFTTADKINYLLSTNLKGMNDSTVKMYCTLTDATRLLATTASTSSHQQLSTPTTGGAPGAPPPQLFGTSPLSSDHLDTMAAAAGSPTSMHHPHCRFGVGVGGVVTSPVSFGPTTPTSRGSHGYGYNGGGGSVNSSQRVGREHYGKHAVVHCSDGWDRTSQVCALAQVMLDPFYRTIEGFCVLIEKDFVSFGHQFRLRSDYYNRVNGGREPHSQTSPVFVQFLDCIYQLMNIYPSSFEFSEGFLLLVIDLFTSGATGTFAANCLYEIHEWKLKETTLSLWQVISVILTSQPFSSSSSSSPDSINNKNKCGSSTAPNINTATPSISQDAARYSGLLNPLFVNVCELPRMAPCGRCAEKAVREARDKARRGEEERRRRRHHAKEMERVVGHHTQQHQQQHGGCGGGGGIRAMKRGESLSVPAATPNNTSVSVTSAAAIGGDVVAPMGLPTSTTASSGTVGNALPTAASMSSISHLISTGPSPTSLLPPAASFGDHHHHSQSTAAGAIDRDAANTNHKNNGDDDDDDEEEAYEDALHIHSLSADMAYCPKHQGDAFTHALLARPPYTLAASVSPLALKLWEGYFFRHVDGCRGRGLRSQLFNRLSSGLIVNGAMGMGMRVGGSATAHHQQQHHQQQQQQQWVYDPYAPHSAAPSLPRDHLHPDGSGGPRKDTSVGPRGSTAITPTTAAAARMANATARLRGDGGGAGLTTSGSIAAAGGSATTAAQLAGSGTTPSWSTPATPQTPVGAAHAAVGNANPPSALAAQFPRLPLSQIRDRIRDQEQQQTQERKGRRPSFRPADDDGDNDGFVDISSEGEGGEGRCVAIPSVLGAMNHQQQLLHGHHHNHHSGHCHHSHRGGGGGGGGGASNNNNQHHITNSLLAAFDDEWDD